MARRGLSGDLPTLRTPRRGLGIHIDDTHPSYTISSEANTHPIDGSDGVTDTPPSPDDPLVYERYARRAKDGSQDALGDEISQWIPMGLVTAFTAELKQTNPVRGDKWANLRMWAVEFLPETVEMTDMLVADGVRYTVQSTSPVVEGGEAVRQRVLLSERVSK